MRAAREGYQSAVARLLNETNIGIDKALVAACEPCHYFEKKTQQDVTTVVKLLFDAGAIDQQGHALQEAMRRGFKGAAILLREAAKEGHGRSLEDDGSESSERVTEESDTDGSGSQQPAG